MESEVPPSNAGPDAGTKTAKDPTAAASLATRLSRSPAIALPAAAAISDLTAELSGAPEELICEGAPGPAGLSPLHAMARISTPEKVMKLKERFDIESSTARN